MIYLDIDGVCVDFLRGALHLHLGEGADRMMEEWPKGQWYIEKVLGISEEAINGRLRRAKEKIAEYLKRNGFSEVEL